MEKLINNIFRQLPLNLLMSIKMEENEKLDINVLQKRFNELKKEVIKNTQNPSLINLFL